MLVPEAEPAIGDLRAKHTWDGERGMPAHVTVLYPFAPEPDVEGVRSLAASREAFAFTLRAVREWPDGVVYLEPDPAAPFKQLTDDFVRLFPDCLPYGGIHDEAIPHCTVVHTDDEVVRADAAASVAEFLPIRCDAKEIWLMHEVNGRWQRHTPFRLGR